MTDAQLTPEQEAEYATALLKATTPAERLIAHQHFNQLNKVDELLVNLERTI